MPPVLVGLDLYKSFGLTQALRGASITLGQGEIVAVMGPSGSGKSTLLYCLAGILTPDFGEVTFDGRRLDLLSDRDRTELRRTAFGFVFSSGSWCRSCRRWRTSRCALLAGRRRKSALAAASAWLPRLGLTDCTRLPGELSGGEGQRVALAGRSWRIQRSCSPTSPPGARLGGRRPGRGVSRRRRSGAGSSVLMVTHEARVAAFADRTVLVRDGLDAIRSAPDEPAARAAVTLAADGRRCAAIVFAAAGGRRHHIAAAGVDGPVRDVRSRRAWRLASAAYAFNPELGCRSTDRSAHGALFLAVSDYFDGDPITRTYVAALGADPPVPLDWTGCPGPARSRSPRRCARARGHPDDELDARFPARVDDDRRCRVTHPDERVAIIKPTPDQLRGVQSVQEVRGFDVRWNGFFFFRRGLAHRCRVPVRRDRRAHLYGHAGGRGAAGNGSRRSG
jgi:putative ABC transport system ATP-binding protein